jgi:esterase/lipase
MINSKQLDDAFKKVNGYFEKEIQRAEDQNDIQKADALKASQKEINQSVLTPWFFYFIQFNPRAVYSGINIPTLVINGKTDVQVWWEDNTQGIKNIVNDAGHQDIEVITYHQLNHLFQTSESGLPLEYASNEETFNESVMRDIAAFILTQKKGKKISD